MARLPAIRVGGHFLADPIPTTPASIFPRAANGWSAGTPAGVPLCDARGGTRVCPRSRESLPTGSGTAVQNPRVLFVGASAYSTKKIARSHMDQRWRPKHHVGAEQRRALQLLAGIPFGTTEIIMLTHHGFKRRTLTNLLHAGLVTIERASVNTEGKAIAAGRIRITAAGRSALED